MRLDEIRQPQRLDESAILDIILTGLKTGAIFYLSWKIVKVLRGIEKGITKARQISKKVKEVEEAFRAAGQELTPEQRRELVRILTNPELAAQMQQAAREKLVQRAEQELNRLLVKIENSFTEEEQRQLLPLINDAKTAVLEKDFPKMRAIDQLAIIVKRFS